MRMVEDLIDKEMEFKILFESPVEVQKKLNQWRHEFFINITGFTALPDGRVAVILLRRKPDPGISMTPPPIRRQ